MSSTWILADSYSFPSARLLRDELTKLDYPMKITSHIEKLRVNPKVRYGHSGSLPGQDTNCNSPLGVATMSRKKVFSDLLIQNNIPSPDFQMLRSKLPSEFPVVIRETLSSSGGRGIYIVETPEQLTRFPPGTYWTPYVMMDFELRVHVAGGKPLRIFKKVYNGETPEDKYPVRNLHRGYHFELRNMEIYQRIPPLVESIQKILPEGCFFYALDIGWNRQTKSYFVLEANSAPGLNEHTAEAYAKAILEEIKHD